MTDIMKIFWLSLLFVCVSASFIFAQQDQATIILLRHAEKEEDGTKDPPLSNRGREFSQRLKSLLSETKVDAIYSTDYKRTRETVMPLAEQNKLNIVNYDAGNPKDLLERIRKSAYGNVVVVGHSNTVQLIFNLLVSESKIAPLKEDEFRKIFVIYGNFKEPAKSRYLKLDFN